MRTSRKHSKHQPHAGFTLAELLVVIVIMGIMFAIALPALTNITGASRLDAAADAVHSAAKLARQYAISHNQPAYLVFNEGQTTPELAYRAYAIFTINTHNPPVTQDDGYFLNDWERLPEGIVFDDLAGGSSNLFVVSEMDDEWNGAISKNNLLEIQGSTYVVHGYTPKGETGSATHWIFLADGFYSGSQLVHKSNQGKQIKFSTAGQSRILDVLYDENGDAEGFNE